MEEKQDKLVKVIYKDKAFELGFAEEKTDGEINILVEFKLEPNEFKLYFKAIVEAIAEYNKQTGKNMIEEIYKEV